MGLEKTALGAGCNGTAKCQCCTGFEAATPTQILRTTENPYKGIETCPAIKKGHLANNKLEVLNGIAFEA